MMQTDRAGITGRVRWFLWNPDGTVAAAGESHNIVTLVGDQYYGERASGVASPPAAVTGMKLGTGTTATAKTGAGAALVTYLANSHQALDAGFPASSLVTVRRIQWQATWVAGKATSAAAAITEVVLVNTTLTDATSAAAATISRALFSPAIPSKAADQALTVTWNHDIGS